MRPERDAWLETKGGQLEEIDWALARIKAEIRHRSPLHAWLVAKVERVARWRIRC